MDILLHNPFRKINRGAFAGDMHCPYCSKHVDSSTTPIGFESDRQKIKLLDTIGPFIRRYQCKMCRGIWRYDIHTKQISPYSSFKRGLRLPGLNHTGYVPLLKKGK